MAPNGTELRIGPRARLIIPAGIRRALGLRPGDKLTARVQEGRLVLETRGRIMGSFAAPTLYGL